MLRVTFRDRRFSAAKAKLFPRKLQTLFREAIVRRFKALLFAISFLLPLALVPTANAQISINIGGPPPPCPYGYYEYAPYGCAPAGFYGPGYFHNGIFLGVGPWSNWGYNHGWGSYRFRGGG